MDKIMYAFIISVLTHALLIFPLSFSSNAIAKAYSVKIHNIEFVPSYVKSVDVVVTQKDFHSKKKKPKRVVKKMINKDITIKGNPVAKKYFNSVREKIISNFAPTKKAKKLKINGKVMAKIQIQKNGSYDLLNVDGKNVELIKMANQTFAKIKKFAPIPDKLEQFEIQLKIPLEYKIK